MRATRIARHQAPGGVVDTARQRLAGVGGAVQVEVERKAAVVAQGMAVDTAQVVLAPSVLVARAVEVGGQAFDAAVHQAGEVDAVALAGVGVVHHEALVVTGGVAVGAFGEVAGSQVEVLELVALQQEAGRGLRQQATVRGAEHRRLHPLLAVGQRGG
ncbi:hypothetical protein D3C78_1268720 [compost metagenome]